MKSVILSLMIPIMVTSHLFGQVISADDNQGKVIVKLIDQYSLAREKMDTFLLRSILTTDIDQLVSNGEWRTGIDAAIQGMLKSSTGNPGTRTLEVDKIRMVSTASAIVDCRYEIRDKEGTIRKMWSSFVVVNEKNIWKISAIRNMVPVRQ